MSTGRVAARRARPVPARGPDRVRHRAVVAARVLVALTLLASPLLAGAPPAVLWALVGLGLLAGVPHGAVDHHVVARATGLPVPVATAAYAAAALAAVAVLLVTGVPGIVAVVAVSVVHFGLGELEAWSGRGRASPAVAAGVALAGTAALLLPLARGGEQVRAVAAALDPALPALLAADAVRLGMVGLWLAGAVVALAHAARTGDRGLALDVVLLGLLGALAPPLVAFALWFGGWHAVRHTGRLLTETPGAAGVGGFLRAAALPSLAAVAFLGVLALARAVSTDPAATTALGLALLLAVTVPHVLVVGWLDLRAHRRGRGAAGSIPSPR